MYCIVPFKLYIFAKPIRGKHIYNIFPSLILTSINHEPGKRKTADEERDT